MKLKATLLMVAGLGSAAVAGPLTDEDRAEWIKLYEEEILAHELYVELGKAHPGIMPFQHIPRSEAMHRDAIAAILAQEGIAVPEAPEGKRFASPGLDGIYHRLLARGKESEAAACAVGVGFEETDIADLRAAQKRFPAAKATLAQLEAASGNHLRAFHRNLLAHGGTFQPAELAAADFEAILAGKGPEGAAECGACGTAGGCAGECDGDCKTNTTPCRGDCHAAQAEDGRGKGPGRGPGPPPGRGPGTPRK